MSDLVNTSAHWAKEAERSINIWALCDDLPCNRPASWQVDKEPAWSVQKGMELNLWNEGDEDQMVRGQVTHYLGTTPQEERCPSIKGGG